MPPKTANNPAGLGLEALAAAHKAYKGHLTRAINAAERVLEQGELHGPSEVIQADLADAKKNINSKYVTLEGGLVAMGEVDPANADTYQSKLDEEHDRANKMVSHLLSMQMQFEQALTPKPGAAMAFGAGPVAGRAKPMTSLRPKVLSREATPVEVTQWIKTFTAYFTASQFAEATLLEQQAHFRSALDSYLTSKVDVHITPATPVLPDSTGTDVSCIELLQQEFLVLKPLFSRRLDYFNYKQQKGQAFTDWFDKLSKKGDEADLPKLTVDDLAAMRMLTGVEDVLLKQEFLRSEKKDSRSLLAVAQNYELGQRYVKSMGSTQNQASSANVNSRAQGGKPRHGGNPAQRVKAFYQDGKCFRCGQKVGNDIQGHKSVCKAKEHTCKKCGKVGHFPSVCLSAHPAQANQGGGGAAPAKAAHVQVQQQEPEKATQPAESTNAVRS